MKVILASGSSSRRGIFESMGVNFEVIIPQVKEELKENSSPEEIAQEIAYKKAENVSQKIKDGIVIGADTIVSLNNRTFGKPKNKYEAIEMLKTLSGTKHKVITGISFIVVKEGEIVEKITDREVTWVKMKNISLNEVKKYVEENLPLDKSGSYAVQEEGDRFVDKIEGDFYNVVGLPKYKVKRVLEMLLKKYGKC